ncbi:MAG: UDP-N-acetylmuramoyl-L-alanine--D-glutamate ligase [Bacteroidales bacterium]|jgi:UDP-N-acetylmuramoylalanine--D-glutamate ligase|nr:UDP-N-acetylmuramoyl-L-alanine--D-glutamate ligase [Bacteroidales bacterium]
MRSKQIFDSLQNKKIVILGFGREGVSSYRAIRAHFPAMPLTIADKNEQLVVSEIAEDHFVTIIKGEGYDQNLNDYDLILKTPGVSLNHLEYFIPSEKISSQTDLFLKAYSAQVIGVTGTKGKSTTSSMIFHLLKESGKSTLLAGNIGIPFFDIMDEIDDKTIVVAELSAHQLEHTRHAPHIAVLLNLYQEHLDHFKSFSDYQQAKMNIARYQSPHDYLIYNADDAHITALLHALDFERLYLPFSRQNKVENGAYSSEEQIIIASKGEPISSVDMKNYLNIPGKHNYYNAMAAILACKIAGITDEQLLTHLPTFKGLEHRIEFVGKFRGIKFYNDSISTIPEATIAAINTVRDVDTLILGGFDRGIDYSELLSFLQKNTIANLVFTGPAGERMLKEWQQQGTFQSHYIVENDFEKIVNFAFQYTRSGKSCLLSPAAASYNQFVNFEERGNIYKNIINNLK